MVTIGVLRQCSIEEHALEALDLHYLLADVYSVASAEVGQKCHLKNTNNRKLNLQIGSTIMLNENCTGERNTNE